MCVTHIMYNHQLHLTRRKRSTCHCGSTNFVYILVVEVYSEILGTINAQNKQFD